MKAVILAAGVGRRLSSVTQGLPKCLITIGGRTLLSRYLEDLGAVGLEPVVLVVGYQQDLIRQAARRESFLGEVRFVVNEDFERGSIVSLWAAREELDDDVVIMDADVLYHPMILRRLVDSPFPNALLLDETVGQQTEECMVVVRDGRVIALTKEIPEGLDLTGEGVGFLKVQKADLPVLLQSIQAHLHVGHLDMEYEDALKEFFQEVPVGYEFVGGWPWVEIDHPGDVECAKHEVVPLLPSVDHKVVLGLSDR